jgi:ribosomal-protein-alanine N-acetyltransferase
VSNGSVVDTAWKVLWSKATKTLDRSIPLAALPLQNWFRRTLESSGFNHAFDVVVLKWKDDGQKVEAPPSARQINIRLMNYDDLSAVHELDSEAFEPLWQHSLDLLADAYRDAAIGTIAEDQSGIVGYQISTLGTEGAHVARLAVRPSAQGKGVGTALLSDLLATFRRRGISQASVNTQVDNAVSLRLYRKMGFEKTDEIYPIYKAER